MNIRYADRTSSIKASAIRELLKLTEEPEIISFAGGLPAPELFPLKKINEVMSDVISEKGCIALQYASTDGYTPLREIVLEQRVKPAGINCGISNIVLTNGSQQGLEFSAKLFINKGDIIVCESPSYLGALNAFAAYEPKFMEISMDENGMKIDELEKVLEEHHSEIRMIYTIPDFQNPSGITMNLERRQRLAELAAKYKIILIEDSPYGELRFEGETLPPIKSFDKEGYVVNLGTFSKTFCPGLRLGWIVASEEIIKKYILIKQGADLQCNTLSQVFAAEYMTKYNLNEHIADIISVYRRRRDLMLSSIKEHFPEDIKYTYPVGGLFTWCELRNDLDTTEILQEALKEKVAFVPGCSFFPYGDKNNYFRLNYSNMDEERIVEGIERLGKVLKKYYK